MTKLGQIIGAFALAVGANPGLGACTADAVVYHAAPTAAGGTAGPSDAGVRADAYVPNERIYGCRSENGGGVAILADILSRLGEDFLMPGMACSTNTDCRKTLLTPACDQASGNCVTCPDIPGQAGFGVTLGLCIPAAAARCCRDPDAPPDCIVQMCSPGCGAQ